MGTLLKEFLKALLWSAYVKSYTFLISKQLGTAGKVVWYLVSAAARGLGNILFMLGVLSWFIGAGMAISAPLLIGGDSEFAWWGWCLVGIFHYLPAVLWGVYEINEIRKKVNQ